MGQVVLGRCLPIGPGYRHHLGTDRLQLRGRLVHPTRTHATLDRRQENQRHVYQRGEEEETGGEQHRGTDHRADHIDDQNEETGRDRQPLETTGPGQRGAGALDCQTDRPKLGEWDEDGEERAEHAPDHTGHSNQRKKEIGRAIEPPPHGESGDGGGEVVLSLGHSKPAEPGGNGGHDE
jgi:hypothetical protein